MKRHTLASYSYGGADDSAAFVYSQTACMLAEMAAMQERLSHGKALAYGEEAFAALPEKYGVHHNGVCQFFAWVNR